MAKQRQNAQTYNRQYAEGGYAGIYRLPYWQSPYYPLYKIVLHELRARAVKSVLEVGCGNGSLAQMLFERTAIQYTGFDLSEVAVEMAIERTKRPDAFYVGDATLPENYRKEYQCIVCTEVLEHVPADLKVISLWPSGVSCICSVPNFDSDYHVRYFDSQQEVLQRYGALLDIEKITFKRTPRVPKRTWRAYGRLLARSVLRLEYVKRVFGSTPSNSIRGWFVFCGKKH